MDSRPAEDSTVVLVWYSPTAIHFGVLAYDRVPEGVRATVSDRDNIGSDDQVTVFLDTFNDRRRAYFFGVNPYGIQDDGVRSEGGFSTSSGMSGSTDRNPDFLWQSKGMKTDFGWVAEIRVPFKSLRWGGGEMLTWGLNVQRTTRRTGYDDTWTDVRRASASFLGQAGTITGIHDIKRGVVTELQPTLTAELPGTRSSNGTFDRGDVRTEIGGNFRLGFTQVTLDGTINPDFSQVESDAGLVTINERFALFFPERRPFFLEGIELSPRRTTWSTPARWRIRSRAAR
ncbi:MAG: carbohydrate binding family 9 domain-containing protein [Gemmatimonadetes bacterium]|nr:carbohydrate binding family 9 domain-containing protein [Gemmatimonadota bacterium]